MMKYPGTGIVRRNAHLQRQWNAVVAETSLIGIYRGTFGYSVEDAVDVAADDRKRGEQYSQYRACIQYYGLK